MSRAIRSDSSPLGPLTRTDSGSIAIVTPEGTGMGCLPILDIALLSLPLPLPDLRQDLAAETGRARVVPGHDAVGGGHDRGAHPAEHLGDVLGVDIRAPPGAGHAAQAGDRRAAVVGVLELDLDQPARASVGRRNDRPRLDIPLLGEDPRELTLEPGRGDVDRLMGSVNRVAHPRQEVGYRIGHGHGLITRSIWQVVAAAATRRTWSSLVSGRCGRAPAGRCGRSRTCGTPRAGARSDCSEYRRASCIWGCASA